MESEWSGDYANVRICDLVNVLIDQKINRFLKEKINRDYEYISMLHRNISPVEQNEFGFRIIFPERFKSSEVGRLCDFRIFNFNSCKELTSVQYKIHQALRQQTDACGNKQLFLQAYQLLSF